MANTDQAERTYKAMVVNASYRLPKLTLAGNYTLGKMWGNVNGENVGSGPIRAAIDTYPEDPAGSLELPDGL